MGEISEDHISKGLDEAMDKDVPSGKGVAPAISLRNGAVEAMDVDGHEARSNGTSKRKGASNGAATKDFSSDDDDKPLVGAVSDRPPPSHSTSDPRLTFPF